MYITKCKESSLWTVLYGTGTNGMGCFWIKIGHSKGPKISRETALMIANKFLKDRERRLAFIASIRPGGPTRNGWKD